MIQINIGGNDGSELLIDSQGGDVCFTVIVPKNSDRTQYDFGIESHEWELLKVFRDKQKELESAIRADMIKESALNG